MSKYPFAEMSVGEIRRVPFDASPSAARVALHDFRQRCRILGYPENAMPHFKLRFEAGSLVLERLPDGGQRQTGAQVDDDARESARRLNQRVADYELGTVYNALMDGEPVPPIPDDLRALLAEHNPKELARLEAEYQEHRHV